MTAARLMIAVVVAAGCYTPMAGRREQTTVSDDAKGLLAGKVGSHDPNIRDKDKAEFGRHYSAAMDAYKHADYAHAIAEFEAAYAIDEQPLLIFNIAQSFRRAGRLADALGKYKEYLQHDPSAERDRVSELIDQTERDLALQSTH